MQGKRNGFATVLATIVLLTITFTAALGEVVLKTNNQGEFLPMAQAMDDELVKNVGDLVSFRVKIKNTGAQASGYLVYVLVSEHGASEWDEVGLEDIWLEPDQYEHLELGGIEVTDSMVGKYYDVQFILYGVEDENLLDSVIIESAWYTPEPIIVGSIIGNWVY